MYSNDIVPQVKRHFKKITHTALFTLTPCPEITGYLQPLIILLLLG